MTPRQARVALGAFVLLAAGVTGNALYLQGSPDRVAAKPPTPPPAVRPEPQRSPSRSGETRGETKGETKAGKAAQHSSAAPSKAAEPKIAEPDSADASRDAAPPKGAQALKVRTVRVATIGEAPPAEAGASPTANADADADTVHAVQSELNRRGYGPLAADGVMRPAARAAIMAFEHEHRLPLTGEASQELLKQLVFGAPPPAGAAGPPEVRTPQAQAVVRDVQRQLAARGYHPGPADGRLSAETIAAIRTFEADQGLVPKGRISVALLDRLESGMAGGGRHREP